MLSVPVWQFPVLSVGKLSSPVVTDQKNQSWALEKTGIVTRAEIIEKKRIRMLGDGGPGKLEFRVTRHRSM